MAKSVRNGPEYAAAECETSKELYKSDFQNQVFL